MNDDKIYDAVIFFMIMVLSTLFMTPIYITYLSTRYDEQYIDLIYFLTVGIIWLIGIIGIVIYLKQNKSE